MAEKKKTVPVKEAAVKAAPAKAVSVKDEPAKTEPVKAEAAKETPVRKSAARKTAVKKAPVKKAAVKEEAVKTSISVQFDGKSYTTEELVKIAKDVWVYDLKKKADDFKSVEIFVKPEESRAYYVINGDVTGDFAI